MYENIYLHVACIAGKCIGEYTIHGASGKDMMNN